MTKNISIHAPLAGRDLHMPQRLPPQISISIHAPLAGRDLKYCPHCDTPNHFNPRAPCGARRQI